LHHPDLIFFLETTTILSLQAIVLEIQLHVILKLNLVYPNVSLMQWLTQYVKQPMDHSSVWLDQMDQVVGKAIASLLAEETSILPHVMSNSRLELKLSLLSHADSNPTLWHSFLQHNTLDIMNQFDRRLFLSALQKHAPSQEDFFTHVKQDQSVAEGRLALIQLQQLIQTHVKLSADELVILLDFLYDESNDLRKETALVVNQYLKQTFVCEQVTLESLIARLSHIASNQLAFVILKRLTRTSIALTAQWEKDNDQILYLKEEENTFKDVYMELDRDVKILQSLWNDLSEKDKEGLRQWCIQSVNDFKPYQMRLSAEMLYQVYKLGQLCSLVNCLDFLKQKMSVLCLVWDNIV
jgi:hypothetical protein